MRSTCPSITITIGNDRRLFVGIDQGTEHVGRLPVTGHRGTAEIRHGRLNDGAGQSTVSAYLPDAIGNSVERHDASPVVRLIGPASRDDRNRVAAAVRLVNAALPESAKMTIGSPMSNFSLRDRVDGNGTYYGSGSAQDNTIYVEFVPAGAFHNTSAGTGWTWPSGDGIAHSYLQFNAGSYNYGVERNATILLAHEMMHTLGLTGGSHVDPRFDSIMEATRDIYAAAQGQAQPMSLLYPVDREAMQVLYRRLDNGDDPRSFGPWSSTSLHIHGNAPHAGFGVALRNGYAEPWAYGYLPDTDLARNAALSGSVTWAGALVGFTPGAAAVAGDAEIAVNIGTLTGRASFTNLEAWAANRPPGATGSGSTWGDGDLAYRISVRGNTFRETGGDAGRVTGIFTGRSHEGAAGTLERSDLTAAFGATR